MTRWEHAQRRLLAQALRVAHGNVQVAAAWLGVPRNTFYSRARKLKVVLRPPSAPRRQVFWEAVAACGVRVAKRVPIKSLSAEQKERLLAMCRSGWRRRLMLVHPDHGGDVVECERLNRAWHLVRLRLSA
jgi:hypothetical protein